MPVKTDIVTNLNSGAKIQKKSHSVKSLRAAFWAVFWAATQISLFQPQRSVT